jgi:Transposase DDE domain
MCLATDGRRLADLVQLAIPVCKDAAKELEHTGPGRPPQYQEWQIAVLIVVAVLHKRKSKSSQWRFLKEHETALRQLLNLEHFPCRDTYCRRYLRVYRLFEKAIELCGKLAVKRHVCCARCVTGDKSLIAARGKRPKGRKPRRTTDLLAGWCYSAHDGWVWGYSYEVIVTAPRKGLVFPLLASVDTASKNEQKSFAPKVPRLPPSVRDVLLDGAYDGNELAESVESVVCRATGRHRRCLCPLIIRAGKSAVGQYPQGGQRERRRLDRQRRDARFHSETVQRMYRRRKQSVEPFNSHLKKLFELEDRVWHRGLDNNRTMILAAIFIYQLLICYAFKHGQRDRQIQWLLDAL